MVYETGMRIPPFGVDHLDVSRWIAKETA